MRVVIPIAFLAASSCFLGACSDSPGTSVDASNFCVAGASNPLATLGAGVGGAFLPFENNQEVSLAVAPQGGFGVSVIVRTEGLLAGPGELANVQLNVESEGATVGDFLLEQTPLFCRGDEGGEVSGVVVGFDPAVYKTNDDLLALNGKLVDLVVTVTASDGGVASVRQPVTIRVGG